MAGARARVNKDFDEEFISYGECNLLALHYAFHALSVMLPPENLHLLSPFALSHPRASI